MKRVIALGVFLALAVSAQAQIIRQQATSVKVSNNGFGSQRVVTTQRTGGLRGLLFGDVNRVVVNQQSSGFVGGNSIRVQQVQFRQQPGFTNSQVLIRQNQSQRLFLNQVNTFTYSPYNNVANVRFVNQGTHFVQTAPIVTASVVQQYVAPVQQVQQVQVQQVQVQPVQQVHVQPVQQVQVQPQILAVTTGQVYQTVIPQRLFLTNCH